MHKLDRGCGTARYEIAGDGTVLASLRGLMVPANAGALSAALLGVAADRGACGVLASVRSALVALPPIDPQHYSYVPPELRGIAVAVWVSPEQVAVYEAVAQAVASAGTMRRAFLSREEAQAWFQEQARALAANRVWRPAYR